MGRKDREDEPWADFHLYNRGVAHRTIFEGRDDVRYFQSRLAREHRRGRLQVHAYVARPNHFHLLATSPQGMVSEAMRIIQSEYVRRFNRLRGRDGPLFRGRFGSRRVKSENYWWTLLRYIDLHSVKNQHGKGRGIYPYGSAYHYLGGEGPRWLTREHVETLLMRGSKLDRFDPKLYAEFLSRPLSQAERELVELRMSGRQEDTDPLDDLLSAGPSRIRELMVERASNADGTRPGVALVSPTHLAEEVEVRRLMEPDWSVKPVRRSRKAWKLLLTGLLRDACGLSFTEVAIRCGLTSSAACSRAALHRKLMAEDEDYGTRAALVLAACLEPFRAAPIG